METIAFARGVPAPEMLPVSLIQEAAQTALDRDAIRILSYGPGGGYAPLRQQLADAHGVQASQILVTTGSLHGFALFVEHTKLQCGEAAPLAFVENPTYDRPLIVLQRNGYRVRSIATDTDGMQPDALEAALRTERPAFIYVIPSFQNPSGATLSNARRDEILALAARYDVPIFEDDPYGMLHFSTPAPATLFSRASDTQVIYANSYSKTISPGLRVGYLVLPEDHAPRLEQYANDTYISPTLLGQATVDEILRNGSFSAHVDEVRSQLAQRCDLMCSAIDTYLPHARYVRPGGGYFLWVDLDDATDTSALLQHATEAGATFVQGEAFGEGQTSAMRLAFSSPPRELIAPGIERIASALSSALTTAAT